MGAMFIDFLNISITASYIIVAVILLRLIFRKIPKKFFCILWAIAGIRLVIPFSIESVFSLIPSAETVPQDIVFSQNPAIQSGIPVLNSTVNTIISDTFAPDVTASANPLQIITEIASVLWIVGIIAILIYGIISYIRVKKTVTGAVLLKDNIWQSENVVSPFILGVFKPKIYVPFGMDGETADYVIAHENAHLKRRDHWIKPLGFLILAVYWFNPLVWVAYILLCKDIEIACDEKVVSQMNDNQRKEYATALLECAVNRRRIAACPLAFGETGLKERVKGVMNYKKPAFWVIILAVAACIVAAVCFLTNPETTEDYFDLGYRLRVTVETYKGTTQIPDTTEKLSFKVNEGTKGELPNGTEFEIVSTNLQTGELEIKFGGEPIYSEIESSFDGGTKKCGKIVLNNPHDEGMTLIAMDSGVYQRINFVFAKTQDIEDAISQAIMHHYQSNDGEVMGTFACESHHTLATEVSGPADGNNIETVTAYVAMDYAEYIMFGSELKTMRGEANSIALTFECLDGSYTLIEYWEPLMGAGLDDSIREKFPENVADEAISGDFNFGKSNEKQAYAYFERVKGAYPVTTHEDIELEIINVNLEKGVPSITVEWHNNTDDWLTCEYNFHIKRYDEMDWVLCGTSSLYLLVDDPDRPEIAPGESLQLTYEMVDMDVHKDGYYRLETWFFNSEKVGAQTAFVDFAVGKIVNDDYEKHIIANVAQDVEFYQHFCWAGGSRDAQTSFDKFAEKRVITQYSNADPISVVRLDSAEEMAEFYKISKNDFSFNNMYNEMPSFNQLKAGYNENFFAENSLFLVYLTEPSGSIRHTVEAVTKYNGVLYIVISRIVPEVGTTDTGGWFAAVEVKKTDISECKATVVRMGDDIKIDEPTTAFRKVDGSVTYTYGTETSFTNPYINLKKNGEFYFFYSVYSSYMCVGTYDMSDEKLVLETDDGVYTYVFKVDGDNLIFDAENSSPLPKFKAAANLEAISPVPDGAVFTKK